MKKTVVEKWRYRLAPSISPSIVPESAIITNYSQYVSVTPLWGQLQLSLSQHSSYIFKRLKQYVQAKVVFEAQYTKTRVYDKDYPVYIKGWDIGMVGAEVLAEVYEGKGEIQKLLGDYSL